VRKRVSSHVNNSDLKPKELTQGYFVEQIGESSVSLLQGFENPW
jgi:hypothetical protein